MTKFKNIHSVKKQSGQATDTLKGFRSPLFFTNNTTSSMKKSGQAPKETGTCTTINNFLQVYQKTAAEFLAENHQNTVFTRSIV